MGRFFRRLGSIRLTLLLFLLLASTAAVTTAIPQGLDPAEYHDRYPRTGTTLLVLGMDQFYRGPLYRGLLALFSVNLLVCGARRSMDGVQAWSARGRPSLRVPLTDPKVLASRLRERGFRIISIHPLQACRHRWAFLGFPLVHLAPPLILAGGLWGNWAGFVGTQTVHVGDTLTRYYNWSERVDAPMPFPVDVEDFRLLQYPIRLRVQVGLTDGKTREEVTREGARLQVPGTPYQVEIGPFDPSRGDLTFWVLGPNGRLGPFRRDDRAGSPVDVRPLAFRDPEVRRAEVRVVVPSSGGRPEQRQVVAVNEPLVHEGVRIYLTAWGEDDYGFPWVGFQIAREPGQALVWGGSLLLCVGLFVLLFGHGAWVRETDGVLLVRGSRGRKRVLELLGRRGKGDVL